MLIRDERPEDASAIDGVIERAFVGAPYSDGTEAAILRGLRETGDLTLSLVAEADGEVIGQIAFSPLAIDGHAGWFGLGPLAVEPQRQKCGVGARLVEAGLARLVEWGARGCALVGSPDYYGRFGFASDGGLSYGDLDRRYVLRRVFAGPAPSGALQFAPAFGGV